jgi:hypothetical protein
MNTLMPGPVGVALNVSRTYLDEAAELERGIPQSGFLEARSTIWAGSPRSPGPPSRSRLASRSRVARWQAAPATGRRAW